MDLRLPPGLSPELGDRPCANAEGLLALVQAALAEAGFAEAAAAAATRLAGALGVDRVYLGVVRHRFCEVAAVSHGAVPEASLPLLRDMSRVMDEAVDQGAHVAFPPAPGERSRITRAHAEFAHRHGAGSLLSVPMFTAGEAAGALVFERRAATPFAPHQVQDALAAAAALAPLVALRVASEAPPLQRLRRQVRRFWGSLPLARRQALAGAVVLVMLGAGIGLQVPLQHEIDAPTRLEGRIQRALVAPVDGFIKSAHVRAGDAVTAGQLLAELADDELLLEYKRRQTEIAQHESALADAMARQDRTALVIAEARAAEARAQLELVEQQLARLKLTAPFDGQVISGDLMQQLAAPVKRGDALFMLTPTRELRVILQVDERSGALVRPGMHGSVRIAALPERRFDLVVERVLPVARVEDGRNVFEAEARLQGAADEQLRPGMQGLARLAAGERPAWWLASHALIDWLRLQWWRWIG